METINSNGPLNNVNSRREYIGQVRKHCTQRKVDTSVKSCCVNLSVPTNINSLQCKLQRLIPGNQTTTQLSDHFITSINHIG